MLEQKINRIRVNKHFKYFKGILLTFALFILISSFVGFHGAANFTSTLKVFGFGISMYFGFLVLMFLPMVLQKVPVIKIFLKIWQYLKLLAFKAKSRARK